MNGGRRLDDKRIYGEVVDLFCGIGALSHGLKRAGFQIIAGYDTDPRCRYAFEENNDARTTGQAHSPARR